jgi:hypothetical protein
LCSQQVKGES